MSLGALVAIGCSSTRTATPGGPSGQAADASTQSAQAAEVRRSYNDADVAFIATNGLTVGHGLTTPDSDEAASKRAMIACARKTVVLADSTKLGVETAVRFATLDGIDVLVTDSDIEPADRRALEGAGVEVVVA